MRLRHSTSTMRALALLLPFLAAACGDAPPVVKLPTQPTQAGANPMPGQQQIGISDQPSSFRPGDTPDQAPAPRTALTGQASALYQQALAAFAAGDLINARTLFTQTTQAEPQSHQAFYSLGVVQERLRDPGATASYRQAFTIVPDYEPAIIAYAMALAKKNQLSEAERTLTE